MSKRKLAVLSAVRKSGGTYVALSAGGCSEDLGFTTRKKDLFAGIAAFAAKNGVDEVRVFTGRNIMNVDGPSAKFKVTVKVE